MAGDPKKEALFNEVKGSLFEYLVGKKLSIRGGEELRFLQSLDKNYLNVLAQQDRMVRLHYPEMLAFLDQVSTLTVERLTEHFSAAPQGVRLLGKFVDSNLRDEMFEADLLLTLAGKEVPISLKLNKRNAFVNTKSGGIKSFFECYFPFLSETEQREFNQLVDLEFSRMARDLHQFHDLDYPGDFSRWVGEGHSELPGELSPEEREILKLYYARIALSMQLILERAWACDPINFGKSLYPLMGFGREDMVQVVCFHDFKGSAAPQIEIHSLTEVAADLGKLSLRPFRQTSSVEISIGEWALQIRVKPMNKFTTTAIKINCSVRFRQPSDA